MDVVPGIMCIWRKYRQRQVKFRRQRRKTARKRWAVVWRMFAGLPENSRVYEAVAMAGGMTEDAGMEAVNQAEFVTDGQMLRIPTMEEVAAAQEESESNVDDGLLDINRASVADFMTLPGIGQSKAEALFQYREAHGRFSSIEEIMNVDGIKEGVFNKIKDSIKV